MAQGIEQMPNFDLLAPVRLNIVCFTLHDANTAQRDRFLGRLKEDGRVLLTPTFFAGKPAIRAAFVNWSTSEQDIPLILNALERCASE
jgi:glutamate/tyrosine decarboxylase-like PLP-dependent enzyme